MGREIKRVATDFNWPINTIWKGYINPYRSIQCKLCDGSGLNPATKKLSDDWYMLGSYERYAGWMYRLEQADVDELVKEGRLWEFTKVWVPGEGWKDKNPPYHPTAAEVNEWAKKPFGHDGCNHWICVKARAKRLGIYGHCDLCNGNGHYWCEDKYEDLCDAWVAIEPPEGPCYQLWETVSEGSPISPAFLEARDLAEWLAKQTEKWFERNNYSSDDWMKFILGDGWAPSFVTSGGAVLDGVAASLEHMANKAKQED